MSRSLKKGPYVDPKLLKKIQGLRPSDRKTIKTWSRDSTITPEMISYTFGVHNGKNFIEVLVNEEMVGFKLGDFAPTRKFVRHGGRMARQEEQVAAEAAAAKVESVQKEPTAVVKVNQLYYPGWRVTVNGQPVVVDTTDNGVMAFTISKGKPSSVLIKWQEPPLRQAANYISLLTLLILLSHIFCIKCLKF